MYLSRGQQSLNCVYLYSGVLCDFDLNDDDSGIQVRCLSITLIIIVRLHVCVRASVVRACVCACVRACMHAHLCPPPLPASSLGLQHQLRHCLLLGHLTLRYGSDIIGTLLYLSLRYDCDLVCRLCRQSMRRSKLFCCTIVARTLSSTAIVPCGCCFST